MRTVPATEFAGFQRDDSVVLPLCRAGDGADFVERARIFEEFNALTDGQATP